MNKCEGSYLPDKATTCMDQLEILWQNPHVQRAVLIGVGAMLILFIAAFIRRMIPRYIAETSSRYKTRKFVNFVGYFLVLFLILIAYSNQLSGITVFLGVAGAGIAFALQEVIASVAGFIAIHASNFYKVGDRVLLGGIKGDVVDIGLLRTSLMEIGAWVNGDLYNGRIVRIANSFVFKEPVYNYTGDFPFLWDEITIPVKTGGDFHYGKQVFLGILQEAQGQYEAEAKAYWQKMTEQLMIEHARIEPMVHMAFDENWITFTLRYVVDYKKRRLTKDTLYVRCLEAIRASEGKLEVASAAIEITAFPKREL